jgi:hypothetical protein
MQLKHNRILPLIILFLGSLISCKKNVDVPAPASVVTPPAAPVIVVADPNKIKDSVLLYTKDLYLWHSQIPSTFDARSFSDPETIMTSIRQYSIEPGFTAPVDRWSFAMKKTEWDNLSGGLGSTFAATSKVAGDFGISVFFFAQGDLRVRSVERESPAGRAGISRSWRITKINGNSNIESSNATFIVDAVYESAQTTFTFLKPDGTTTEISLTAANYKKHPVHFDAVYTVNSKKIGYLVFNSFLGDTVEINNEFNRVFNNFSSQNVSDVIIDLRYNGGGYVSVQKKLANYLINASANNSLMMKEQYNDKNASYNSSVFFKKTGSLNLNRVFFIVSSSTASASELLINNLKPYMDVKLIGPSNTHGKPVGYFPVPVGEWYIFPVSFRTTNKNGEGNYFNGFPVNSKVNDGINKDWGDITESCLASSIKFISSGAFRTQGGEVFNEPLPEVTKSNSILDAPFFKGIVETNRASN